MQSEEGFRKQMPGTRPLVYRERRDRVRRMQIVSGSPSWAAKVSLSRRWSHKSQALVKAMETPTRAYLAVAGRWRWMAACLCVLAALCIAGVVAWQHSAFFSLAKLA